MSLSSFLRSIFARKPESSLAVAVADDGTGPDPDPGQPTPLRADPETGALLVKDTSAASNTVTAAPGEGAAGSVIYTPQLPPELEPCERDGSMCLRVVTVDPVIAAQGDPNADADAAWGVVMAKADGTAFYDGASEATLSSIDGKLPALVLDRVPVDPSGVTQPISAASLPLPSGAATSALQGAGLPESLTAGGGVKAGLVDPLPTGTNPIGSVQADLRIGGAANSTANPVIVRPDPIGRTLGGASRVAEDRALFYCRHAPFWMISLGGTSARHEYMDVQLVSGGTITYLPNTQSVRFAVPAAAGARASYRQRIWNPYRPGSPTRAGFNFVADAQRVGCVYRAGVYDDSDGLFLERDDTGTYFVTRSSTSGSVANTRVALVGLNISLANLYRIAYEWFGAGDRELTVNGAVALLIAGGGVATVPYMKRPNLPFTVEIENVSGANSSYLDLTCVEVDTEGAGDFLRRDGTFSTTTTSIGTGGKMVAQIRPAATITIGTVPAQDNRGVYVPRSVQCSTTGGPAVIRVYDGGTVTGASFAATSDDPGIEADIAGTFTGATGRLVAAGTIDNTTGTVEIDLSPAYQFPGRTLSAGAYSGADTMQIVAFSRTGSIASLDTFVRWQRIG